MAKIYSVSPSTESVEGFLPALSVDLQRSSLSGARLAEYLYDASPQAKFLFFEDLIRAIRLTHLSIPVASRVYARSFLKKAYKTLLEQRQLVSDTGIKEEEVMGALKTIEEQAEELEVVRLIGPLTLEHIYFDGTGVIGVQDPGTIAFGYAEEDIVSLLLELAAYCNEEVLKSVGNAFFDTDLLRIILLLRYLQDTDKTASVLLQLLWKSSENRFSLERENIPYPIEVPNLVGVTVR